MPVMHLVTLLQFSFILCLLGLLQIDENSQVVKLYKNNLFFFS